MTFEKPNILFIFSDQHRKFDLGCYGNSVVQTPNLDDLARQGLRFEHCISNSPVCVPARGSILTGLYAQKHGAFTNDLSINYNCQSIADVCKKSGYHTGYIGKWHLAGIPRTQYIDQERRLGFEEWKVANCNHHYLKCYYDDEQNIRHNVDGYEPEIFGQLADNFIRQNQNTKPWMLFLSFATPHDPHTLLSEEYRRPYDNCKIHIRQNFKDSIMVGLDNFRSAEEQINLIRGYYGHITAIDKQIGQLIKTLEETGQMKNTIIIYTSDHGDMLGSQGYVDKQLPYEESIGVPLIAVWKGKIPVGVTDALVGLVDLPVTLLGLIGQNFDGQIDGQDLSQAFCNLDAKGRSHCYIYDLYPCHQAARKGFSAWRGVRTEQYTYAVTPENKDWLLFDNVMDPYQLNNLACDPACKIIKQDLWEILSKEINQHDALVSGDEYVISSGKLEEFNNSQICFGFPPIIENPKE